MCVSCTDEGTSPIELSIEVNMMYRIVQYCHDLQRNGSARPNRARDLCFRMIASTLDFSRATSLDQRLSSFFPTLDSNPYTPFTMAVTRKRPTLPKLNGKPSGQKKNHGHPRKDAEPKPKPPTEKKPADGVKRNKWGKKPKPEQDEDDSGYDEAPAGSEGEDDGFGFDLTASLAGTSKISRFARTPASVKSAPPSTSKPAAMEVDTEEEEEVDEDEDAEIMAMMGKKSVKNGVSTVKAALGKGKSKEAKTMVGGGSWQSMGM